MNIMSRAQVYKAAADLLGEYCVGVKFIPCHFGNNIINQVVGLPAIQAHDTAPVQWAVTVVIAAELTPNIAMGTPFTRAELALATREMLPRNVDHPAHKPSIFY